MTGESLTSNTNPPTIHHFAKKMSMLNSVKDEKIQFKVAARFRPFNQLEEV